MAVHASKTIIRSYLQYYFFIRYKRDALLNAKRTDEKRKKGFCLKAVLNLSFCSPVPNPNC